MKSTPASYKMFLYRPSYAYSVIVQTHTSADLTQIILVSIPSALGEPPK